MGPLYIYIYIYMHSITKKKQKNPVSNLIPQHDAETSFTIRLIAPLEKGRTFEWIITSLFFKKERIRSHTQKKKIERKNILRKQNNSNTTFHRELLRPHHDHE